MLNKLRKLLGLCVHEWEIFHKVLLWDDYTSTKYPVGTLYHLKCKHCGNIKSKRV